MSEHPTKSPFEKDVEAIINEHYKHFLKKVNDSKLISSWHYAYKELNALLLAARNEVEDKYNHGRVLPLKERILLSEKLSVARDHAIKRINITFKS